MKSTLRLLLFAILSGLGTYIFAQETTATLRGIVTDSKGASVTGASVIIKMQSTGFQTGTQTNSKGIFIIPNLKPGGPYTIII
ncbi:MAG: carboxypeptidase-like regulatory domain-containing protein, partial [Chitinophagales bacterium]